jgi:hypothetical protein
MIANPRQILDEPGHTRQRPQIGLVTLRQRAGQQRGGHRLRLPGREFGFGTRGSLAGQGRLAPLLPSLFTTVSHLTGDAQTAGDLGGGMVFGEELARFQAAFSHLGMIAGLSHTQL